MIWFVHRTGGQGTPINWAGQYQQPGYADEAVDDAASAELKAFLTPPPLPPQTIAAPALAQALIAKGVLLPADVTAAMTATKTVP
jgi:hypothetical protein